MGARQATRHLASHLGDFLSAQKRPASSPYDPAASSSADFGSEHLSTCACQVHLGSVTERVEVSSLEIAYERAGSGPPLVLLHGHVGDGPTSWRHQIDNLRNDFTVLACDAP